MRRLLHSIALGLFCIATVFLMDVCAQETNETTPLTNHGRKWRIGYVEGGPYANYQSILHAMIEHLMSSGWIQPASMPECLDDSETRTLWNFLSTEIESKYLEFPPDAYWTPKWDNTERENLKQVILNRLNNTKDIDLLLAFGTWAGQDFANNQHRTPMMVLSASNAVRSGIIKSIEDSGFDHVHAWIRSPKI